MAVGRATIFLFIFTCALFSVSGQTTGNSGNSIEHAFLARDDGRGNAGDETRLFKPHDVPIHCVVRLANGEPVTVKLTFVAVDVKGVAAGTKVVTASFTTTEGHDQIFFVGKPAGKWSPGRYRVDLTVGSTVERELEFEVIAATVPAGAAPFARPTRPRNTRKP